MAIFRGCLIGLAAALLLGFVACVIAGGLIVVGASAGFVMRGFCAVSGVC